MTSHEYLVSVLVGQQLSDAQLQSLRDLRARIEQQLSTLNGSPRFYYAGSYGKKTMIRERFDLDIVSYWPSDCGFTLKDIYNAVGSVLQRHWNVVTPKTVAWRLPFEGGFSIDVVPGRAIDYSYRYANLYRRDRDSSFQTSIKVHLDTVRNSGRQDAIRLMKLWRARNGVTWDKSLALELMTIDALSGSWTTDLGQQLMAVFQYVYDRIEQVRLVDPANSNNVVSDELTPAHRANIKHWAKVALDARTWGEIFRA